MAFQDHPAGDDFAGESATVNGGDVSDVAAAADAGNADADKSADLNRALAVGWTERTAFDYDQFTRAGNHSHAACAAKYEWKDEFGDVGPEIPELRDELFGGEFRMRQGAHLENITSLTVNIEGQNKVLPVWKFEDAGLHPIVMQNITLANYTSPTPIQAYTIPAVLHGYDVVAVAQTGSGKTDAYMIPIISKLMGKAKKLQASRPDTTAPGYNSKIHGVKAEPLIVIVVPTRELAMQIFDEARRMCYRSMLRPCVSYGGFSLGKSIEDLRGGCDILVATPGRLCDLMDRPDVLTMSRLKFTVIDEADEMLHSDWEEELRKIMSGGDTNEDANHQYMMFSATFPAAVRNMAAAYMAHDYARIRVGRAGSAHKNIRQVVVQVDQDNKRDATYDLLMNMDPARTIVFCNSKITVDLLDDYLYNRGLPTTSIHSERNQIEREDAMRSFRCGRTPILIATGVSARGWDVMGVKYIINYDLPSAMYGGITEYIHRIGRTARIGHQGLATSFYNERNEEIAQDLVNTLVECDCEVPDFLQHLVPEDGVINFDDKSDDGDNPEAGSGGFSDAANGDDGVAAPAGWGAPAEGAADSGFTADAGFTAAGGAAAPSGW